MREDLFPKEATALERVNAAEQWVDFAKTEADEMSKTLGLWMHMQKHISALDTASRPEAEGPSKQQMTVLFSALFVAEKDIGFKDRIRS